MNQSIFKILEKYDFNLTFLIVILISILFKIIISLNSFGPYAIDDYNHNVIPAYGMYTGIPIEIPEYRSPLFVWFLKYIFEIGNSIGLKSKIDLLKFLSLSLGVLFFLSNLGIYLYLKSKEIKKSLILFILIFYNLHFYIIYASTKSFGEFFSVIFLLNGIGLIEMFYNKDLRLFLLGIFLLGISSFFRFQNGIFYIAYILYWILFREKKAIFFFFFIGFFLIILQSYIDIFFHREPLSTLLHYLKVNKEVSKIYGRTGYFSYVLLFLGFSLFPLSLIFLKSLKKFLNLIKVHGILFFLFMTFLIVHSIIPHQEERFIFPILPLFIIMFSQLLFYYKNNTFTKKYFLPIFLIFHIIFLILTLFNKSQVGSYFPIVKWSETLSPLTIYYREETFTKNLYLVYFFTFDKKIQFVDINSQKDSLPKLTKDSLNRYVMFLTNQIETKYIWDLEKNNISFQCTDWITETSLIDKILYHLNPKINLKRAPAYYFICDKEILIDHKD